MGMSWGSTTPGELFTGSKRWQCIVSDRAISISFAGSPTVVLDLVQLHALRVRTGVMWATCHLDWSVGNSQHSIILDGIPNEKAQELQRVVTQSTAEALARLVSASAPALEHWLDRVVKRISPQPGKLVEQADIAKALVAIKSPPSPGDIPWSAILGHAQAGVARARASTWPAWAGTATDEVVRRIHGHNKLIVEAAIDAWLKESLVWAGRGRWIPKSAAPNWVSKSPAPHWPGKHWEEVWGQTPPVDVLRFQFDELNDRHLSLKRTERKHFFDTVEKNPLTDEQKHACICMDDSVLVVAAAGSGKTSTMVAKTGYALQEGLATPDQILLLAFNVATAREVGERIREQLKGVPSIEKVTSKTFHSFGIEVIAAATGKMPDLAPWVSLDKPGDDIREIADIVRALSEVDVGFKAGWHEFRSVYARDIGRWGERQEPDAFRGGKRGFLTAQGEIVKSKEETLIADWLFYHGVNYQYERAYEHDTASQQHRQYYPDFYYPDLGLYHEHFALDANGLPPEHFTDYMDGVLWKRAIHKEKQTELIETTSEGLRTGDAIAHLRNELVRRGVQLKFDAMREAPGQPPIEDKHLARSFRVFQQHVKNNGLSSAQLHKAMGQQSVGGYAARLSRFLSLYERIAGEWDRRLRDGKFIDFEDMLLLAAKHIESGRFQSPYTIILADEFQDSSRARIRLLKALATTPSVPTHLCVVGDDWQGINRFAGSDISVMTEFERTFEHATKLTLNTTFRCPQDLCNVSSDFIQANPAQIAKSVKTTNPLTKTPMLAYGFQQRESITAHIEEQLGLMHQCAIEGKLSPLKGRHITIMLVGRYRDDKPAALEAWKHRFGDRLNIEFKTAHGSKGLEAEYVFILNVTAGPRGFPSQLQDDSALQMAMPAPDPFPFAEERRLFYVAITRARKQVRLYTTMAQPSQFLVELVARKHLTIEPVGCDALEACPRCEQGVLVVRKGGRGEFHGCSRFPRCDFTRNNGQRIERLFGAGPHSQPARTSGTMTAGSQCPLCSSGIMRARNGRNGRFLGCSTWPACPATSNLSRSEIPQRLRR